MPLKHLNLSVFRLLLGFTHLKFAETGRRRIRPRTRPGHEVLERRLALDGSITTYDWVARGDGVSWSDPNNWIHIGPIPSVGVPGVPVGGSNVEFPPLYTLPAGSPLTINFNSPYSSFPINLLTIEDSFTFSGNPITVNNGVIVANPPGKLADATILLSGVTLGSRSTIYTQQGSTLNLADSADPTGLKLGLEGGVTKGGGGQLFIDTQSVIAPYLGFNLQPFEIAGGTVTMGTSVTFTGSRFQVDSNAALDIAAAASVRIAALAGSGTVDIQGTGSANDTTSLKISEPAAQSDKFTGLIDGVGQLILQGNGTLTTGAIDFSDGGGIQVLLGTLVADGAVSVGTLSVSNGATFGGVGPWHFSGSAVFQAGTNYALTLDGLTPGTQYTQLVNGDSTAGINLGNSKLTATIGYQYQAGDQFTIATGPLVQGVFQNVQGGTVLLGNNVPFSVSYSSTAVTLTALQSETTTALIGSPNPSNPGQPVTFTATASTRTQPVTTGSVSFMQGGTVLATVGVTALGQASYTTSSLPLGTTAITAVYNGSSGILGSTSPTVTQSVVPYTTLTSVSTSANPSRIGQPLTFTAAVTTAAGTPVTTGTIGFTRGNKLLATVAVGPDGTASLSLSSLPIGQSRIQAVYDGTPDYLPSVSPFLVQSVSRLGTVTTLTFTTQTRPNGRVVTVLEASVGAEGIAGITPIGTVVFRRNGKDIGKARLNNGVAMLALGRQIPARGKFVAGFQGGSRFLASTSSPGILPA